MRDKMKPCEHTLSDDVVYKDVVIIGNGPSGLVTSYMLAGNVPYLKQIPDHLPIDDMLRARLSNIPPGQSLYEAELMELAEGIEGRSQNPIPLLMDSLLRPCADMGINEDPLIEWRFDDEKQLEHVVLGRGPVGGAWPALPPAVRTVSPAAWLSLPPHPAPPAHARLAARHVAEYCRAYVRACRLQRYVREGTVVHSVTLNRSRGRCDAVNCTRDARFCVSGVDTVEGRPFRYVCRRVVLASGASDRANTLAPSVAAHALHSLADLHTALKVLARATAPTNVIVVGSGVSAADAVRFSLRTHNHATHGCHGTHGNTHETNSTLNNGTLDNNSNGTHGNHGTHSNTHETNGIVNNCMLENNDTHGNSNGTHGNHGKNGTINNGTLDNNDTHGNSNGTHGNNNNGTHGANGINGTHARHGSHVLHVHRAPSDSLASLPANNYPDYAKVYKMMCDGPTGNHKNYTSFPYYDIIEVTPIEDTNDIYANINSQEIKDHSLQLKRVKLQNLATKEITEVTVSLIAVLIGSKPDLSFLQTNYNLDVIKKSCTKCSETKHAAKRKMDDTQRCFFKNHWYYIKTVLEQGIRSCKNRYLNLNLQEINGNTDSRCIVPTCNEKNDVECNCCEKFENSPLAGGEGFGLDPKKPVDGRSNPLAIDKTTHELLNAPKGLYALGPLTADNFIRFIPGGALAIVSNIHREIKEETF